jgi:hypothetical protein
MNRTQAFPVSLKKVCPFFKQKLHDGKFLPLNGSHQGSHLVLRIEVKTLKGLDFSLGERILTSLLLSSTISLKYGSVAK